MAQKGESREVEGSRESDGVEMEQEWMIRNPQFVEFYSPIEEVFSERRVDELVYDLTGMMR